MEVPWEAMLLPPWPIWRGLQKEAMPSLLLLAFASEGVGNTSEAAQLASVVQSIVNHHHAADTKDTAQWRAPVSWSHLFGNSPTELAY